MSSSFDVLEIKRASATKFGERCAYLLCKILVFNVREANFLLALHILQWWLQSLGRHHFWLFFGRLITLKMWLNAVIAYLRYFNANCWFHIYCFWLVRSSDTVSLSFKFSFFFAFFIEQVRRPWGSTSNVVFSCRLVAHTLTFFLRYEWLVLGTKETYNLKVWSVPSFLATLGIWGIPAPILFESCTEWHFYVVTWVS